MKQALAALLLGAALPASAAGIAVRFPGPGLELAGRLYEPAATATPAPAIVMLHGCSGMWTPRGDEPTASYAFWAEHFRARGYVVLLVDSFGPRGEREICTQAQRRIRVSVERRSDAHAARRWLAARTGVDAARIHLMGWSNGGSTVLYALRGEPEGGGTGFRSAAALYPGCASLASHPYAPVAPLLIQAGAADDWTPARHCEDLARQAQGAGVEIDVYPEAHHSFDRVGSRVRERPEVRNPNRPDGRGATVGPQPEARARAITRVTDWFARHGS